MKKKFIYIGGILLAIILAVVIVSMTMKKNNNGKNNNTGENTIESLANEKDEIEDELDKIEVLRKEKTDLINKYSEQRGKIMIDHPDWGEMEIRGSKEYKELTEKIEKLEKEVEKIDNSKLPYYDREIEIQDEMRSLEQKQEQEKEQEQE